MVPQDKESTQVLGVWETGKGLQDPSSLHKALLDLQIKPLNFGLGILVPQDLQADIPTRYFNAPWSH